jgi:hypothetical protein
MERKPIMLYFQFGRSTRFLMEAKAGRLLGKEGDNKHVLSSLKRFFGHIKQIGLQVTDRAAGQLRELWAESLSHKGPTSTSRDR